MYLNWKLLSFFLKYNENKAMLLNSMQIPKALQVWDKKAWRVKDTCVTKWDFLLDKFQDVGKKI